jgi:hypothetical protein
MDGECEARRVVRVWFQSSCVPRAAVVVHKIAPHSCTLIYDQTQQIDTEKGGNLERKSSSGSPQQTPTHRDHFRFRHIKIDQIPDALDGCS